MFIDINLIDLLKVPSSYCSTKLIRLIKMTMKNTKAKVKIYTKMSASYNGVKQGVGLSAVLFNIALHLSLIHI